MEKNNVHFAINAHYWKFPIYVLYESPYGLKVHEIFHGHVIFLSTLLFKQASSINRALHVCIDTFDFLMQHYLIIAHKYGGLNMPFYGMCTEQYFVENSSPTTCKHKNSQHFEVYTLGSIKTVTCIRVTAHFIFQPYRYVVACVTWLTPGAPFIVHTQNGDAARETAAFIGTLKSVLRGKYRLLVHLVNNNRKNIYQILLNAMFL